MPELRRFFGKAKPVTQAPEARTQGVSFDIVTDKRRFASLIKEMRVQSMLPTRVLANRLGVRQASLNQYFYRKRGSGGTSTLKWFLRFAEACGCRLYITFPSARQASVLEEAPMKTPSFIGVGSLEEKVPDAETQPSGS
jgi:hypothetical protein